MYRSRMNSGKGPQSKGDILQSENPRLIGDVNMLNLSNITNPSPHIQERARAMWATKYDQGEHTVIYRVVPFGRKFEHRTVDRRLVVFDVKRGTADCLSLETGEICEANSFGKLCSHVYRASCVMNQANQRRAA